MAHFKRNVSILSLCQALFMSGTSMVVATTALVGFALADNKAFASLAFASQLLATMLTSIPASMLMARIGHKPAFLIATVIAMAGAVICTIAILKHMFALFIAGSILLGVFSGFANYYRFTVADTVGVEYKSRAIAWVLAGGVLAAFIGPNLARLTRDTLGTAAFAGSYASINVLYILSFILLLLLKLPVTNAQDKIRTHNSRTIQQIVRQPRYIIAAVCGMLGYAIMSLVMTATPLAMQHHAHPFDDTSFVIQWHVLGMFLPSFFSGQLIHRFGVLAIMTAGAICTLACVLINLGGTTVVHFWLALLLLGVGWNFLFIGATTLLTETYAQTERFKAQAVNDFMVFSVVAAASLGAGLLQHLFGWRLVNIAAIPAIGVIFVSLLCLRSLQRDAAMIPVPLNDTQE